MQLSEELLVGLLDRLGLSPVVSVIVLVVALGSFAWWRRRMKRLDALVSDLKEFQKDQHCECYEPEKRTLSLVHANQKERFRISELLQGNWKIPCPPYHRCCDAIPEMWDRFLAALIPALERHDLRLAQRIYFETQGAGREA